MGPSLNSAAFLVTTERCGDGKTPWRRSVCKAPRRYDLLACLALRISLVMAVAVSGRGNQRECDDHGPPQIISILFLQDVGLYRICSWRSLVYSRWHSGDVLHHLAKFHSKRALLYTFMAESSKNPATFSLFPGPLMITCSNARSTWLQSS